MNRTPCPHCQHGMVFSYLTIDPSEQPRWRDCVDCNGTGYSEDPDEAEIDSPDPINDCDELMVWGLGVSLLIACALVYRDIGALL